MKEKKDKKTAGKAAIKTDNIVAAYRLLTTPKTQDKDGMRLSALETKDIFIVLRATHALKPAAVAFDDFCKDARERLKPDNWDETISEYEGASAERKAEIDKASMEYGGKVSECVSSELEKEKEIDAYERLSEEAFGTLVKDNGHLLDVRGIMLLQEILV